MNPLQLSVLPLVDVLEDVFETPVVGLEDGVLGAHVQRPLLLDGILEAAVSKSTDGLCKENTIIKKITSQSIRKLEKTWRTHSPFHVYKSIKLLILTLSVLYIPIPQPPAGKSYTSHSFCLLPSAGENTILNVPGWSITKSVALYCEIKHQTWYVRLFFSQFGCVFVKSKHTFAFLT